MKLRNYLNKKLGFAQGILFFIVKLCKQKCPFYETDGYNHR